MQQKKPIIYYSNMSQLQTLDNFIQSLKETNDREILAEMKLSVHRMMAQSVISPELVELFMSKFPQKSHLKFGLLIVEEIAKLKGQSRQALMEILVKWFYGDFCPGSSSEVEKIKISMCFMGVLLNREEYLNKLLEMSRNSENKCIQLLKMFDGHYERIGKLSTSSKIIASKSDQYGYLTNIVIFCLNVIKAFEKMNGETICLALNILRQLIQHCPQIIKSLSGIIHPLLKLLQRNETVGNSLQVLALFIRYSEGNPQKEQAQEIIDQVAIFLPEKIKKGTDLSGEKSKLVRNAPEKLKPFNSFFEGASEFVSETLQFLKPNPTVAQKAYFCQLNLQLMAVQNYTVFKNSLKTFISQAFPEMQDQKDQIEQCEWDRIADILICNCFPVFDEDQEARQALNLLIGKLGQYNKIPGIMSGIQKAIQDQFQLEFDEDQFNNACYCFCALAGQMTAEDKVAIQDFLKILLNLNESIGERPKKLVGARIQDLLATYPFLLEDNEFMTEVVEDLMIKSYPSSKLAFQRLADSGQITERVSHILEKKLTQRFYGIEELISIWTIILSVERAHKDSRAIDQGFLARNVAGKRLMKGKWQLDEAKVQDFKQKIKRFSHQYSQELELIQELLGKS